MSRWSIWVHIVQGVTALEACELAANSCEWVLDVGHRRGSLLLFFYGLLLFMARVEEGCDCGKGETLLDSSCGCCGFI